MRKQKPLFLIAASVTLLALLGLSPYIAGVVEAASTPAEVGPVPQGEIPQYIVAAVNSPDRPAKDRELDASRQPEQLMTFFGIKPGMRVADLWAGGGYTTELLARIVGPKGKVYSQNMPFTEKFKKAETAWQARLKEPGMTNVVEVTKPFDAADVLPVEAGSLDAVFINMNYHDLFNIPVDPTKLNAAVFKALKPGGFYCVVDNSAQAGSGTRDTDTLHRIDESFERKQIEQAGFKLAAASSVLRNPKDPRTQPFWKVNHTQDRFVLKFEKPA